MLLGRGYLLGIKGVIIKDFIITPLSEFLIKQPSLPKQEMLLTSIQLETESQNGRICIQSSNREQHFLIVTQQHVGCHLRLV